MVDPSELVKQRRAQHGDWMAQSAFAYDLKELLHRRVMQPGGYSLQYHQIEALEMILTKVSRIVCGDPNHADHWDDIAGYAHLGKGGHDQ